MKCDSEGELNTCKNFCIHNSSRISYEGLLQLNKFGFLITKSYFSEDYSNENLTEIMRTFIFLLQIFLLGVSALFGQFSANKWYIVEDAKDKVVFIDTSSVKKRDNLLSVWSMTDYREPVFSVTVQRDVKKIKTKYLFNTSAESFTVIGTIFYDATGRLITDTEIPQLTGGNDEAYLDLEDGTSIRTIYDKSNIYNLTGNIEADPSEYLAVQKENNELPMQDSSLVAEVEEKPVDTSPIQPTQEEEPPATEEVTPTPEVITPPVIETPPVEEQKEEEPPVEEKPTEYNFENERAVRGTIFTDGNLYCYQVSSWKRKNVAEQETQKLKDKGFEAFIMEAEIPGRGIWYRVRVGYFNSLDDALASQRSSK